MKRYKTVEGLVRNTCSSRVQKRFQSLLDSTRLSTELTLLRVRAGLTQARLAARIGSTQSAVSKLEAGPDKNLTTDDLRRYARGLRVAISVTVHPTGKLSVKIGPMNKRDAKN